MADPLPSGLVWRTLRRLPCACTASLTGPHRAERSHCCNPPPQWDVTGGSGHSREMSTAATDTRVTYPVDWTGEHLGSVRRRTLAAAREAVGMPPQTGSSVDDLSEDASTKLVEAPRSVSSECRTVWRIVRFMSDNDRPHANNVPGAASSAMLCSLRALVSRSVRVHPVPLSARQRGCERRNFLPEPNRRLEVDDGMGRAGRTISLRAVPTAAISWLRPFLLVRQMNRMPIAVMAT